MYEFLLLAPKEPCLRQWHNEMLILLTMIPVLTRLKKPEDRPETKRNTRNTENKILTEVQTTTKKLPHLLQNTGVSLRIPNTKKLCYLKLAEV